MKLTHRRPPPTAPAWATCPFGGCATGGAAKNNFGTTQSGDAEKAGDKAAAQASDAHNRSLRNQADAIDAQHEASVEPQLSEPDRHRTGIYLVSLKVEIVIGMNLQRLPMASERAVQALAAAMNRARPQALVGQPLPSESDSEAVAAKVTPTLVPDMPAGALSGAASSIEPTSTATAVPGSMPTTAAERAVAAPATALAPPSAVTPAAEPVKKAADAVNLLRGLPSR